VQVDIGIAWHILWLIISSYSVESNELYQDCRGQFGEEAWIAGERRKLYTKSFFLDCK